MRRLPLWGQKASNRQINFEWPSQDEFDQMSTHVRLTSLEFKYNDAISSVRCVMSDSNTSPVFESQSNGGGSEHSHSKRINFNAT